MFQPDDNDDIRKELEDIERRIRELLASINFRPNLEKSWLIGKELWRAKLLVTGNQLWEGGPAWTAWLKKMRIGQRTAQRHMQVYRMHGGDNPPFKTDVGVEEWLKINSRAKRDAGKARREEWRESKLARPDPGCEPPCQVITADCREFQWPAEIDLIATDPPWADMDAYRRLAEFAVKHLRPKGLLLVQHGTGELTRVAGILEDAGLTYRWQTMMFFADFHSHTSILPPFASCHRSTLVFSNGEYDRRGYRTMSDLYTVRGCQPAGKLWHGRLDGQELVEDVSVAGEGPGKWWHEWEQPLKPWRYWLERLTQPGDLVADPFAGSATIGVACKELGRRYLGTEIDPDRAKLARIRIAEAGAG